MLTSDNIFGGHIAETFPDLFCRVKCLVIFVCIPPWGGPARAPLQNNCNPLGASALLFFLGARGTYLSFDLMP